MSRHARNNQRALLVMPMPRDGGTLGPFARTWDRLGLSGNTALVFDPGMLETGCAWLLDNPGRHLVIHTPNNERPIALVATQPGQAKTYFVARGHEISRRSLSVSDFEAITQCPDAWIASVDRADVESFSLGTLWPTGTQTQPVHAHADWRADSLSKDSDSDLSVAM